MPALLRIFTRVNLLVMVGEEQGTKFIDTPSFQSSGLTLKVCCSRPPRSLRRYHGLLLELRQRFPDFDSCASLDLPVSDSLSQSLES